MTVPERGCDSVMVVTMEPRRRRPDHGGQFMNEPRNCVQMTKAKHSRSLFMPLPLPVAHSLTTMDGAMYICHYATNGPPASSRSEPGMSQLHQTSDAALDP